MKKILCLVLSLALLLGCCVFAQADGAYEGKLVILHTNDVHGHAVANDTQLGYARVAALKKALEAQGASVLLLDAGDAIQGAPIVNMSYGKEAVNFMNAAGYDAATLGNHEFDWGLDNILQLSTEVATYPYLCANILYIAGGNPVFTPNKIFEVANGLKVGVFGLDTPETMTKAHPDKVKGVTFLQGEELVACAQAQIDELTAAGCDVIIALAHLGNDDESIPNRSIDILPQLTGLDVFIDAHSHTVIDGGVFDEGSSALRVSTGSYSAAIGYIVIDVDKSGEEVVKTINAELYDFTDDASVALLTGTGLVPDPEVDKLVNDVDAFVDAELGTAFAKTEVLLDGNKAPGVRTQETNLGDFAADAILWAAQQYFGDQVVAALTNGGGIRASIQIGDVTMKDMKTVFPFGNEVAILTVTGAELLEALEAGTFSTPDSLGAFPQVSGIEFTIDTSVEYIQGEQYSNSTYFAPANPGSRVTIKTVGGKDFDPEAMYTIATNDFTAAGGDTYGAFAYAFTQTGIKSGLVLEDALINYTSTVLNGVIGEQYAEPAGRIIIK
ncbi:MAG: bifunctional UDP-sugar hydrolase/5'-nucleotidase [Clostridia bacterium]|nr:bifunctional UDP-sugar hydrolase/5'-nucleotidase [Clostridia bacterium]